MKQYSNTENNGTFHGGETLPTGTFHGGETLPTGTFHGGETLPTGTFHGGETLPTGTFHGGETLPTGTFHGGASGEHDAGDSSGGEEPPEPQSGRTRRYRISTDVLNQIMRTVGTRYPEQGGALGIDKETGIITRFYFDRSSRRSGGTYSPDSDAVTKVIRTWEAENVRFCGMIHSHPGRCSEPSEGDRIYAEQILRAMPDTLHGQMFLPIVTVDLPGKTFRIHSYAAELNANQHAEIMPAVLFAEQQQIYDSLPVTPAEAHSGAAEDHGFFRPDSALFQRNLSILPLDALSRKTVVVIGCGGARGFCESLARSAVTRFVLVDGDTVSETNIATQGTYHDEIGQPKTAVIAETLRRINPDIEVIELHRFLDAQFPDSDLEDAVGRPLLKASPEDVLLCGCTDNFAAQDRTVKLALRWGVPYLASQTYAEGRGGEVLFTYPGVTAACPRCMLASRYQAYENGTADTSVTSEGAPIYSTERLNALKSHIAMMLLLYGTDSRIGRELELVRDRNLVLVSFAPDCEDALGITAFSRSLQGISEGNAACFPMEQTVWLQQKPDRPENGFPHCPYCGGTGDACAVRNMIADTREPFSLSALIRNIQTGSNS